MKDELEYILSLRLKENPWDSERFILRKVWPLVVTSDYLLYSEQEIKNSTSLWSILSPAGALEDELFKFIPQKRSSVDKNRHSETAEKGQRWSLVVLPLDPLVILLAGGSWSTLGLYWIKSSVPKLLARDVENHPRDVVVRSVPRVRSQARETNEY